MNARWKNKRSCVAAATLSMAAFVIFLGALFTMIMLSIVCATGAAGPLDTWNWRNSLPTGNRLLAVAYGNKQFVAVGDFGTVLTSRDGVMWSTSASGTEDRLNSVAYGNDRFVAVGFESEDTSSGTVISSTDGVNWIKSVLGATNGLRAVVFGASQFVAVGENIFTSPDGLRWKGSNQSTNMPFLSSIAFGNGTFVAVGSTNIFTSRDGMSWTGHVSGQTNFIESIAFGNNLFVAVGGGGENLSTFYATVLTSPDGLSWTPQIPPVSAPLDGVWYLDNQFFAVDDVGAALTSPDGVHWTSTIVGPPAPWGMVFGDGQFVGVGDAIMTSTNGTTWSARSSTVRAAWLAAVDYDDGQFVTVGTDSEIYDGVTLNSSDGITWTDHTVGTKMQLNAVTHGRGQFVAVGVQYDSAGNPFAAVAISPEGFNWINMNLGVAGQLSGVAFGNGQFVAVGSRYVGLGGDAPPQPSDFNGTILSSSDGASWVLRSGGTNMRLFTAVAYGNGRFVAVGGGRWDGSLVISADGTNWSRQGSFRAWNVTFGNNLFVALGDGIMTSGDGITWTCRNLTPDLQGITYGNGQFIAVGGNTGNLLTSPDGVTWTRRNSGTGNRLDGIAYGNGSFVAVGENGTILQSGPVIRLTVAPETDPGQLSLMLEGPTGANYTIQSSTDLVTWRDVTTITGSPSSNILFGGLPSASGQVFFRAKSSHF